MQGLEQRRASEESPGQGRIRAAPTGLTGDLQRTIYGRNGNSDFYFSSPSLVEQRHVINYPTKQINIQKTLDSTNLIDSPVALLQTKTTGNITRGP